MKEVIKLNLKVPPQYHFLHVSFQTHFAKNKTDLPASINYDMLPRLCKFVSSFGEIIGQTVQLCLAGSGVNLVKGGKVIRLYIYHNIRLFMQSTTQI